MTDQRDRRHVSPAAKVECPFCGYPHASRADAPAQARCPECGRDFNPDAPLATLAADDRWRTHALGALRWLVLSLALLAAHAVHDVAFWQATSMAGMGSLFQAESLRTVAASACEVASRWLVFGFLAATLVALRHLFSLRTRIHGGTNWGRWVAVAGASVLAPLIALDLAGLLLSLIPDSTAAGWYMDRMRQLQGLGPTVVTTMTVIASLAWVLPCVAVLALA